MQIDDDHFLIEDDVFDSRLHEVGAVPAGQARCKACGRIWPESHLETDSGDCITCEDERDGDDAGLYD